jgi:hypothetical protein
MFKISTPPSFAHAFDVANNVAVFESCLRKNLVVAFTYEIFNVWLIDNVVANQCGEQREQGNAERLKKGAAVAGGSRDYREASNRVDRSHSVSRKLDTPQ